MRDRRDMRALIRLFGILTLVFASAAVGALATHCPPPDGDANELSNEPVLL